MSKKHLRVVTTYPVAIKHGQGRIHVPDPIPWHIREEHIKCPECETIFSVTEGFAQVEFLKALKKNHEDKQEHPDYITSAPEWTKVLACECGWFGA
jgi:hypothetical protein